MDNVNKPGSYLCGGYGYRLPLHCGHASGAPGRAGIGGYGRWIVPRSGKRCARLSPRALLSTGMALSLLVLGFMAFRLLIKDKVKPSAAPVRQTHQARRARSPLCPAEKAPLRTLPPALAAQVRLLLVTGDDAAIEQLVPGLRQQHWLEATAPC